MVQEYSDRSPHGQAYDPSAPSRSGVSIGFGLLGMALLWASACAPPDRPPLLVSQAPEGVGEAFHVDGLRALSVSPGLAYFGLRSTEIPLAVHLLRMDLGRCEMGLQVLSAPVPDGSPGGFSPVTDLVRSGGLAVVAGVNGDFFTPEGTTVGTEVVRGVVRRIRDRPAFAWRPGKNPWMGVPKAVGDSALVLGWVLPLAEPGQTDGDTHVVGGFPLLLENGRRVGDLEVASRPSFAAARHPRTAVGFDAERNLLWIVVVDGRQPGHSDGMTLPELTSLLEGLGVSDAVNLDGGGSSVMVVRGLRVSRPSDAEGERPVVNALAVRRDRGMCVPSRP